jgi:hypothetical protein
MSEEEKKELPEQPAGGQTNTEQDEVSKDGPKEGEDPTVLSAVDAPEGVPPTEESAHPEKAATGESNTGPKATQKDPVAETEDAAIPPAESTPDPVEQKGEQPPESRQASGEETKEDPKATRKETPPVGEGAPAVPSEKSPEGAESEEDPEKEIDESIAEDAEDSHNERRHQIPILDYHALTMENLVGELQRLLRTEKIQAIRKHAESIKREFDLKFQDFIEHKKEEFISRGGEPTDFRYNSVTKRQFNELFGEYRDKRNQYYKELEQNLQDNLQSRLQIIEELKGLVSMEEDMNTTYKNFKELQQRWRNAGPVPRTEYNNVWRTFQHHVEIFYDFLSLNRELRDLDFKYNLEEKERLCEKAEALLDEEDINKAFRELQILHKIWKEEVGPVAKDQREAIWERFSEATKKMHLRRQEYFQHLDEGYRENLEKKKEIIAQIEAIAEKVADHHRGVQNQIRQVETLRGQFFQAGKVPQKDNEATWSAFKSAVRAFNRNKNAFYKGQKKEQQQNLDRKKELLSRALELKDSEEWEAVTPEMKRIQREWKEVGHVPRKYSEKIWKEFKEACNHYFNRLHASKNSAFAAEKKNLELKTAILQELREFKLSGTRDKDLAQIQDFVSRWKAVGHVPRNKKHISSKFYKILDALFRKLGISQQEAETLKYGDKIAQLEDAEDERAVERERQYIRKKIDEVQGEIRQLENNLNFFSNASEENPMVKEVINNLEGKKGALKSWMAKLKKLNILRNTLRQEAAASDEVSPSGPEDSESEAST